MNDSIAQILVVVSQAIVIVAQLAQYIKILSTKTTKGLSGWSYTLVTGSVLAWAIYGIKKGIVIFYVSHFISMAICFAILGHLYTKSKIRRKMEVNALIAGSALLLALVTFPEYAGWLGFTYTMMARVPQYKHIFTDNNIRGISLLTHLLFIIVDVCTIIYANYYSLFPLMISAMFAMASSLFIMFMVAKKSVRAYN